MILKKNRNKLDLRFNILVLMQFFLELLLFSAYNKRKVLCFKHVCLVLRPDSIFSD